ncbi:unnamed protein product [Anisakis simplex]|uniref:Neur_chan_LBD domain-containing protein n=1 Tax=Anisakis simplex TaxID=6269 RepID=A0A158PPF7_ANISI|nr:unnamed protein product [Anisakis simplex]
MIREGIINVVKYWKDDFLQWNPNVYEGATEIFLSSGDVWIPEFSLYYRDAKFRLGIMTLMSMSVILLAIVEDMPKFSMSSTRRGRGSFSGIPLIGLYYFILLAIIGLSTVTTSMFVFLERDVRVKHRIPWYLGWLSFDITNNKLARTLTLKRHSGHEPLSTISSPSPRQNIRKRLSIAHYDNMLIYQYFTQILEDITKSVAKIECAVQGIREEIVSLLPQDDLYSKWQTVIRRLELISLMFYISLVGITAFMFFYHDWYCAIGHNPCGQLNLKCPWMQVEPTHPHCL